MSTQHLTTDQTLELVAFYMGESSDPAEVLDIARANGGPDITDDELMADHPDGILSDRLNAWISDTVDDIDGWVANVEAGMYA